MAKIEKELGIPEEDWQGAEMVVIEIKDPAKHNLRIPSGQEDGASELWLPGGHLPKGHDEAVTGSIPIGSYEEMSVSDATKNTKTNHEYNFSESVLLFIDTR